MKKDHVEKVSRKRTKSREHQVPHVLSDGLPSIHESLMNINYFKRRGDFIPQR